ncbi:PREDICTED: purine nucleoside phosphorylase-like isoform X2 [Habropoda laboriosa]|uniref:purine nucleoside phosphorylase-like isoform X2 n=1 Tax=Habropoda laboriosa TaxID=597456 RepID=UPI00083E377B|nr:PREDICTED: purine nucleoside phosphorylase-like isoform X2 [Habropoda laboriosa]
MPFTYDLNPANTNNDYQPLKRPTDNEFLHTVVKHLRHNTYTFEALQESAQYLLDRIKIKPKIGVICGSGMGSLADIIEDKQCFPYEEIPHFPASTVKGHQGQMVFGYLKGVPIMCMQGRFHYYEGYPLWKCVMPVRVMKLVGVTHLIATNAAGGLNPTYKVGDIMMVKDHVNMMGFAGNNPLQGPNDDRFGPRFPPMSKAYCSNLLNMGQQVAEEMGIGDMVHKGVYICLGGPNFETVAELKMLRMLGVDAVGMSTVHEVITARHCDLTVFAFSLITNQCVTDYESLAEANHEEVIDVGSEKQPLLQEYVSRMVLRLRDTLGLQTE